MNKPHIETFSLLKLLAVIGILCCHTGLIKGFDACARMVEILFVTSGFLTAYNHYEEKNTPTPWQIVKKKLPRFYPIHVFCFLLQLFFVATWAQKPLYFLFSVGILNLSLQHAWFVGTEFSYNNVSWFLAALIFAYAASPSIKRFIKSTSETTLGLALSFFILATVRFYLEYLATSATHYVPLDLHCNPFAQMLNFSLGYTAGAFFLKKNILNTTLNALNLIEKSVLQLLFIALYLACCQYFFNASRFFFVLLALPMIYSLAFKNKILVSIASFYPIKALSNLTLEIFMLHSFILYKNPTDINHPISYVIFFTITLASAIAYHLAYNSIKRLFKK